MKFGHAYKDFLENGGFPAEWVVASISYQKLKKCIKKVKFELASLGLDPDTLHLLLERAEGQQAALSDGSEEVLRYEFGEGTPAGNTKTSVKPIRPKLLILVDEVTGEPVDARLASETRQYIHELALKERLSHINIGHDTAEYQTLDSDSSSTASTPAQADKDGSKSPPHPHRMIEVPLTTDSEFFGLLSTELSGLAELQEGEKSKVHTEIASIGTALVKATEPSNKAGKTDLDHWRRIFELYMDSQIFFAMTEQDRGTKNFTVAQERYNKFLSTAQSTDLLRKFKRKDSFEVLQRFLRINTELLQHLRFQEINQTAMVKILKKFDKRTSLNAKSSFPALSHGLLPSALSKSLSQSLAQEITTRILSTVPALDDYLCPICSEIAWRPIRLRCNHIFCIWCLIKLQNQKKDRCPLCREPNVVMQADATCLDEALIRHMKMWFPKEVKAKQRLNEDLSREMRFGLPPPDPRDDKCCVM